MHKCILAFLLLVLFESLSAKTIVDCRVVTGAITECNPYGRRLHHTKKITYDLDRQKLIIARRLPLPHKNSIKIISVADMIEKYVKVEESIRFKGSDVPKKNKNITLLNDKKSMDINVTKKEPTYITYNVKKGDSLSRIAKQFGFKSKALAKLNGIRHNATLHIGQKLKISLDSKMMKSLISKSYEVEDYDTLISIAKKFNLSPKLLAQANHIKDATTICKGKILLLPFEAQRQETERKRVAKKKKSSKLDLHAFGKRQLRVTATAYSSHGNQTDSTPFLAAWNNRLRPGMKIIAVSRDMLTKYGMRNGTKVRIGGLRGYYRVRDKMNKRYKKRIDIYMGLDRRRALRWGKRSVVIYW
jgi:LysM repeat protein